MQHVSTSWTLILKIVIPTLWLAFFSAFALALTFSELDHFAGYPISYFRAGYAIFFLCGFLMLYWLVLRLKRVELDEDFVYATNFLKNYRYPYQNVRKIEIRNYGLFRTIRIHLIEAGKFGKRFAFIANRGRFYSFFRQHPQLREYLSGDVEEDQLLPQPD